VTGGRSVRMADLIVVLDGARGVRNARELGGQERSVL